MGTGFLGNKAVCSGILLAFPWGKEERHLSSCVAPVQGPVLMVSPARYDGCSWERESVRIAQPSGLFRSAPSALAGECQRSQLSLYDPREQIAESQESWPQVEGENRSLGEWRTGTACRIKLIRDDIALRGYDNGITFNWVHWMNKIDALFWGSPQPCKMSGTSEVLEECQREDMGSEVSNKALVHLRIAIWDSLSFTRCISWPFHFFSMLTLVVEQWTKGETLFLGNLSC